MRKKNSDIQRKKQQREKMHTYVNSRSLKIKKFLFQNIYIIKNTKIFSHFLHTQPSETRNSTLPSINPTPKTTEKSKPKQSRHTTHIESAENRQKKN